MANNPNTKLQANFKMANGDLINVYADNQLDFEIQLTALQDCAELIRTVSNTLTGRSAITPIDPWTIKEAVGVVEDVLGGTAMPTCKHGYMLLKTGTSAKSGKPYKGWTCSSKDRKEQCDAQWIN